MFLGDDINTKNSMLEKYVTPRTVVQSRKILVKFLNHLTINLAFLYNVVMRQKILTISVTSTDTFRSSF